MEVTAAVIYQGDKILIAQRKCGNWEFPGGKIEANEKAEDCLVREIAEELAVEIVVLAPLLDYYHQYPDKRIRLISFTAKIISGCPNPLEHSKILWVKPNELSQYKFLAADLPIVELLMPNL